MVKHIKFIKAMVKLIAMYEGAIKSGVSYFNYKCDTHQKCPLCHVVNNIVHDYHCSPCPWVTVTGSKCSTLDAVKHQIISDPALQTFRIAQIRSWIELYKTDLASTITGRLRLWFYTKFGF